MRLLRSDGGAYSTVNYLNWQYTTPLVAMTYKCSNCNRDISSSYGYWQNPESGYIYICPECGFPTYFDEELGQHPGVPYGEIVKYVDDESVKALYEEARRCVSSNSYTAAVLCCRKLLMNIAVANGAKEGMKFFEYVTFLKEKGFVPPGGNEWVDTIRKKGNEATHEISIMTENDSKIIITFVSMLLKIIYEMPNSIKELTK